MAMLTGKVALVTGSSRGIGAAIAALFAREGAKVVVHGRDRAALSEVASAIERSHGSVVQVTGDVTKAGGRETRSVHGIELQPAQGLPLEPEAARVVVELR